MPELGFVEGESVLQTPGLQVLHRTPLSQSTRKTKQNKVPDEGDYPTELEGWVLTARGLTRSC